MEGGETLGLTGILDSCGACSIKCKNHSTVIGKWKPQKAVVVEKRVTRKKEKDNIERKRRKREKKEKDNIERKQRKREKKRER